MKTGTLVAALAATLAFGLSSPAVESPAEKYNAAANKNTDLAREYYRNSKDEICELINGKMECVAKKLMNKTRTAADKAKTKAKEIKNKID